MSYLKGGHGGGGVRRRCDGAEENIVNFCVAASAKLPGTVSASGCGASLLVSLASCQ